MNLHRVQLRDARRLSPLVKENKGLIIGAAIVFVVLVAGLLFAQEVSSRRTVPDVTQEMVSEARELIEAQDLTVDVEHTPGEEDVRVQFQEVVGQSVVGGGTAHVGDTIILKVSAIEVKVPNFVGMLLSDAEKLARETGVSLSDGPLTNSEFTRVFSQDIPSGKAVKADSVSVKVETEVPQVTVPEIVGSELEAAITQLSALGLEFNCNCIRVGELFVGSVSPAPGTTLEPGSNVELVVGVKAPNLVGMNVADARAALSDRMLSFKVVGNSNSAITSQSVPPDTIVAKNSTITVTVDDILMEYRVTGNGSIAMVTWAAPGSFSISQDGNASLPWSMSFPRTSSSGGNFNAQILDGSSITCQIIHDGKVVREATSTGMYAVVSCG